MNKALQSFKRTVCCSTKTPTMYSLDLKTEDSGWPIPDKIFSLLRDYLQPDSTMTLEFTARSLEDLIPVNSPLSTEVLDFGDSCIEVAEQIPYHHPSHLKLAGLLEYLANSPKLGQAYPSKVSLHSQIPKSLVDDSLISTQRTSQTSMSATSASASPSGRR